MLMLKKTHNSIMKHMIQREQDQKAEINTLKKQLAYIKKVGK